jgi:hypothetical protein
MVVLSTRRQPWRLAVVNIRCRRISSGKQITLMKTASKIISCGAWLVAAGVFLTGCASTPDSRANKNAAAVASWPADVQAKVKAGHVAVGFTQEQVRVAMGDPDRTLTRTEAQVSREVWVYVDHGPKFSFGLGVGSGGGGSGTSGAVGVSTGGRGPRELMRVVFEGDLVSAIEQMKR